MAATASGLAVLCVGLALRPADPPLREVVVAARDLPTGQRLSRADLALAAIPASIHVPGTASAPDELSGAVLSAPVLAGEPVSRARLVRSLAGLGAPSGRVPMPVRFADPAAVALLSAGQVLDVLSARASGADDVEGTGFVTPARVLAPDALVLAVTAADGDAEPGLPDGPGGQAPMVVLALTPDQARAVAGAQASSRLSFTLGRSAA